MELFEELGRDPGGLIGLEEADWLDFKKAPYQLDEEKHCFDLAKDVSAIANGDKQGVIVIGVETELIASTMNERAKALRPIADGFIEPRRIQDVIHSWVHPALDVTVRWHPLDGTDDKLWTIVVDLQRDRDRPFMVLREFVMDGKVDRSVFGVYRRVGSRNTAYPPTQVQQWLHVGWTGSLEASSTLQGQVAQTALALREGAEATLADDVLTLTRSEPDQLYYYIQVAPAAPTQVERFFEGSEDSLFDALQHLPQIRRNGFNFPDWIRPERTSQSRLRIATPPDITLSASREGVTTALFGQRYLTWAADQFSKAGEILINPIALVEFTLEFWRLCLGQVAKRFATEVPLQWRAGMRSLGLPRVVKLPARRLEHFEDLGERPAIDTEFDLPWRVVDANDPRAMAYTNLIEIYAQFGLGEATIPFAQGGLISEERLLATG